MLTVKYTCIVRLIAQGPSHSHIKVKDLNQRYSSLNNPVNRQITAPKTSHTSSRYQLLRIYVTIMSQKWDSLQVRVFLSQRLHDMPSKCICCKIHRDHHICRRHCQIR